MRKKAFIAVALIASLVAVPVSVSAELNDGSAYSISDDLDVRATGSNASTEESIPNADATEAIKNEEEILPSAAIEEITSLVLDVEYGKDFRDEDIRVDVKTQNCIVSDINVVQYNLAEITVDALDGYKFYIKSKEDITINGADLESARRKSTSRILVTISNNAPPESSDSDSAKDELGKAYERFQIVMDEINSLGVHMSDANTKEELYDFLIGRFQNASTKNIEFEMEITDHAQNGPGKFIPAVAGTPNNPDGINGRFGLWVDLWIKGNESEKKTVNDPGITIYATPYKQSINEGSERYATYDNERDDTIFFYKNGKLLSVLCKIYYNNYRYGRYTTVQYNSIGIEKFDGRNPNIVYNYSVIKNGGYGSTYTEVFVYVNGEKTYTLGGPKSSWIKFHESQLTIPVPTHSLKEGDFVEIYIDGFSSNSGNGSSSSGGSSGGSGGGGSSSGGGATSTGMLITKQTATSGTWEKADDKWKLKLDDGSYASSQWAFLDGKWYMFDGSGNMITGWKKANSKWYLLSQSGDMVTGWQLVDGKWYWLEPSGEMVTGWKWVGEKCYYMDASGAMLTNSVTPDGYHVNENGEWIQ